MGETSLVTGGAGFIGSNLVRALLERGSQVLVVDDFSTGKRDHLPSSDRLTIIEGDLANMEPLEPIVRQCTYVFHMAARVGNIRSIDDPVRDAQSNVLGTVRLLAACRGTGIEKVIYSASCAAFGEAEYTPIDEEHPQRPVSFYALSKLTGEQYVRLAWQLLGVPTVCLRYFNVFGSPNTGSDYAGVIAVFAERLRAGDPLTIFGDGSQYRDFVYVKDVVAANLLAASRGAPGGVYNIATGRATSILELAELLGELAGRVPEIQFQPFREGEVRQSVAAITRARTELGFEPRYDLRAGLAEMWR